MFIIQSGVGKIEIDGELKEVKAGDTVIIPAGAFRKVYNNSNTEDFSFMLIFNDKRSFKEYK